MSSALPASLVNSQFYFLIMLEARTVFQGEDSHLERMSSHLPLTSIKTSTAPQGLKCTFLWEEKRVLFG